MILLVLPDIVHDDTFLRQAKAGNPQAIIAIYDKYLEPIYQFVYLRVGNEQLAEDITSETFLAFVRAIKRNKGPRHHLRGWLFQVARNKIANQYGESTPLPLDTIEQWIPDDTHTPEFQMIQHIDARTIREMIQTLSADQQEVLLLRFDQQLSLNDTADIMGKNINTVKTLQYRALHKLRQIAEKQF